MTLPASHPKKVARREEKQKVRVEKERLKEERAKQREESKRQKRIERIGQLRRKVTRLQKQVGREEFDRMFSEFSQLKGKKGASQDLKGFMAQPTGKASLRLMKMADSAIYSNKFMNVNRNVRTQFKGFASTFATPGGIKNIKGAIDRVVGKMTNTRGYSEKNPTDAQYIVSKTARTVMSDIINGKIKNKTGRGIRTYARGVAMTFIDKNLMKRMSKEERKAVVSARPSAGNKKVNK